MGQKEGRRSVLWVGRRLGKEGKSIMGLAGEERGRGRVLWG